MTTKIFIFKTMIKGIFNPKKMTSEKSIAGFQPASLIQWTSSDTAIPTLPRGT